MALFPFQDELMVIAAVLGVLIAFYFQLTGKLAKSKAEERAAIFGRIDEKTSQVITSVKDELKVMDSKFTTIDNKIIKSEDDIEDVEDEMKTMVQQFRDMCDKLSKHQFILDDVLPDFKSLQKEFNHFKNKVDIHMYGANALVNTKDVERNTDRDEGEMGTK